MTADYLKTNADLGDDLRYELSVAKGRVTESITKFTVPRGMSLSNVVLQYDSSMPAGVGNLALLDGCRFGDLTQSWLGEDGDPSMFARRIAACSRSWTEEDGTYAFEYKNQSGTGDALVSNVHTIWVDPRTSLVSRYLTIQTDKQGPLRRDRRYSSYITERKAE